MKKLDKKLTKAIKALEDVRDELKDGYADQKPDLIPVPDEMMQYIEDDKSGDLVLLSKNQKMALGAEEVYGGIPTVTFAGGFDDNLAYLCKDKLYLKPCKREELKQGDLAFRAGYPADQDTMFDLWHYCIILNDKEHANWNEDTMHPNSATWNHWYKIVR